MMVPFLRAVCRLLVQYYLMQNVRSHGPQSTGRAWSEVYKKQYVQWQCFRSSDLFIFPVQSGVEISPGCIFIHDSQVHPVRGESRPSLCDLSGHPQSQPPCRIIQGSNQGARGGYGNLIGAPFLITFPFPMRCLGIDGCSVTGKMKVIVVETSPKSA